MVTKKKLVLKTKEIVKDKPKIKLVLKTKKVVKDKPKDNKKYKLVLKTKKNSGSNTESNTGSNTGSNTESNTESNTGSNTDSNTHSISPQSKSKSPITTHKYTKYYPSILDPNFSQKIANHNVFKKYKLNTNKLKVQKLYESFENNKDVSVSDDYKKKDPFVYILKPIQKLLRNFISPYTPYKSLLIYHEMGVGKTCTAITIAEALKSIVTNSKTKIYVIRPDEIVRQLFDINVVSNGNPNYQCTGDTYLKNPNLKEMVDNCSSRNKNKDISCAQLKSNIDKEIKKIYEFIGAESWANNVDKELKMKTKGIHNENEKAAKERQIISKRFNNSVIIIDEAHNLHDNSDNKPKVVPPVLNKVLKYSSNLRLILLTATPIYDKPQNIISIINYFLINDKRNPLKENDVFDNYGNLKSNGRKLLEENTRGYISYLRGNNPYEFPIRLSAKYNIPDQMLDLKKYPKYNFNNKKMDKTDKINHLELVDCPLQKNQLDIINYYIKNNHIKDIDEDEFDKFEEGELDSESDIETDNIEVENAEVENTEVANNEVPINNEEIEKPINKKIKLTLKSKANKTIMKTIKKSLAKSVVKSVKNPKTIDNSDTFKTKGVAYQLERQLSNFVYLTLDECNNNAKFSTGSSGLNQIATKQHNKWTYQFNDPEYGKRFKLPELKNWGAKIAKVVERIIASKGTVFVYTSFIDSGVIPVAFALEMNGYRRYKQNNIPLLDNKYKDATYRGDYIIYTGNKSLSLFAKEYLDNRSDMINETSVKVFIGTSKASQGLNLFGYREVHILDPWHNINLIEQSIGRVIRTGSHSHLPPQERNVTVYQYATTMGDRESFDLKIYKICENKAIKAGVVEKILKENAFDCELNKDVNFYDSKTYGNKIPLITSNNKKIMVSLADAEYSRSCFYMKDCDFKCNGNFKKNDSDIYSNVPIMKFNFEKDVEEYKNLILQLIKSSLNLKIDNLKNYLQSSFSEKPHQNNADSFSEKAKPKRRELEGTLVPSLWEDEEIFNHAIQEIINTDLIITDNFNRKGKIILAGEYLRFIPEGNTEYNISIQKQQMKTPNNFSQIDLKEYISILDDKHKKTVELEKQNYDEILNNSLFKKTEDIFYELHSKQFLYNVKISFENLLEIIFTKLIYSFKLIILKTLLEKIINNQKLSSNENKLESIIKSHIININDIFPNAKKDKNPIKNIYGFIIQNESKLEFYQVNDDNKFEKTLGNINKIIEFKRNIMNKTPYAQLYGFIKSEKQNSEPVFKIADILSKGDKKSVKGLTCISKTYSEIKKTINKLDDKIIRSGVKNDSRTSFCNDVEILLRRNDAIKKNGKKWFYNPEDYFINFEYDK